jgi:hypothetical protein
MVSAKSKNIIGGVCRVLLSFCLLALLFWLCFVWEPYSLCRLIASVESFCGVFLRLFGIESARLTPLVGSIIGSSFTSDSFLSGFGDGFTAFWRELWDESTALLWVSGFTSFLEFLLRFALTAFAVWLAFMPLSDRLFSESGVGWRDGVKGWGRYLRLKSFLSFLASWLKSWWAWFRASLFWPVFVALLVWGSMAVPAVLDLVSLFFGLFTIDLSSFPDFIVSACLTVFLFLRSMPLWVVALGGFCLWVWLAFARAERALEARFLEDRAFVRKNLGVVNIIKGLMRSGKTTKNSTWGLLKSMEFRDNCFANMERVSRMFPDFPFQGLENDILVLVSKRLCVNYQQAGFYVYWIYRKDLFQKLYGYDPKKTPGHFTGNSWLSFRDALAIYAESYFVYSCGSSMIASNFGVRDDAVRMSKGHLVLWDEDLVRRDNSDVWSFSMMSHVLIWDALRFGRKADPKSPYLECNGPSVVLIQEGDKERGNMLTNAGYNIKDATCNPKNDLFDYAAKLGGHLATIWHECLFCIIIDTQRLGAISQGLTDVAQNVFTADKSKEQLRTCLHGFYLTSWILELMVSFRDSFVRKYRFSREDRGFLFGLVNWVGSSCGSLLERLENRYGYADCHIGTCTVSPEGDTVAGQEVVFHSLNFIDYGERFESTCMDEFLNVNKRKASLGFFDLPTYKRLMPSKKEWEESGSFLVSDLEGIEDGGITARFSSKASLKAAEGEGRSPSRSGKEGR